MGRRCIIGGLLASAALVVTSAAAAKEFKPGDLRVCNARRCAPIIDQKVLNAMSFFYYGARKPRIVHSPRLGVPFFELRFRNGYATGIVATTRLDRFLSYGVNLDQFHRGTWYRVPARAAGELRRLTAQLKPLRLTRASISKSH